MTGNRFGNGIEFREGEPIQLLEYKENSSSNEDFGKIDLNPEALDILRDIREPLAIISVVGSYRRGKSWFANVLHGRHDGFDLGAKVEGCTRGIYMWSPPFKLPNKQPDGQVIQTRVIVLDSEGIDDPKQDQNWATKLFILCLAVSSTFIYNINGIVGRDDIGKLYLMTDLSKFIQEPEDGDFLPRLVILLRDFSLENPESFKDYFLEKLDNVNPEAAVAIGKFFCDFDVYGLSHPGCRKKMLQHLENVDTEDLDDDFVEEVEYAVKSIYSRLPLKYIGSSTMKGLAFVKFLKDIVERMNSSETSTLLSIPSEYESIIQFVAQEAIKEASEMYENEMNDMMNQEGIPMLWDKFDEIHDKCVSDANKLFYEKIIGNPTQMEGFFGKLNERTSKCKELLAKRNSEELMSYNDNLAKTFWEKYVKIGLTQENLFESTQEFQEALKAFEIAYEKSMMASPESAKVIVSYMQDQFPAATDYMKQLGRMNAELARAMHAKEEAEKLRLESLAREEEFRREIEAQKRERQENEKNFQDKISELQTNIERQQKSHEEMKQRLIEDREHAMENYNQKIQEILSEQRRQQEENEEAKMELLERQQEKFNEMQRTLAEQHRKANEQIRNQLIKDKNDTIAQQNKRFKEEIDAKNKETQELINKMRRENQSKKGGGICVIA